MTGFQLKNMPVLAIFPCKPRLLSETGLYFRPGIYLDIYGTLFDLPRIGITEDCEQILAVLQKIHANILSLEVACSTTIGLYSINTIHSHQAN